MKSKKSNHTRGKGTPGSRGHGQDDSDKQNKDKKQLKGLSKTNGKKRVWVIDPNAKQRAAFPSDFSKLRQGVKDNFCYRIPRLVPGPNGEEVPMPRELLKKRKEKKGRLNRAIPEAYAVVVPGQPDIDAGVDGWIIPDDTDEFVIRGNRMDSLLETFSRVGVDKVYEKDLDGDLIEVGQIPRVRNWWAESSKLVDHGTGGALSVKTNATTISMRDTIGVSPAISRALQRMIEDGFVEEARLAAEATMEPFGRVYEEIYRGPKTNAKVTSMVGHASLLPELPYGHFHFDHWVNATFLAEAETGVKREVVPVRCWDAKATCHHGPGPGATFWTRHLDILGDLVELAKTEPEAAERAGYTAMLCDQAISGCRKRAVDAYEQALMEKAKVEAQGGTYTDWIRPPDDYARDIRIHRELDRIFTEAIRGLGLEKDYVDLGKAEYRQHLIEAYKAGEAGIRMDTPEDLAQVAKVAERAEKRARVEREAAEKALLALGAEKEAVARLRAEVETLRSGLDADAAAAKVALTAAEKAQRDAETALVRAEAEAKLEAAPILAAVRKAEAALPAKEAAAELSGGRRLFLRFFPNGTPTGKSVEKIVEEIQKDVLANAEQTAAPIVAKAKALEDRVALREQSLSGARKRLAGKIRGWRNKIQDSLADRVAKEFGKKFLQAYGGFVAFVLGDKKTQWFRDTGADPTKAMINEVARSRNAEAALEEIVKVVKPQDPKGEAAKALAAGKAVLAANKSVRNLPPGTGDPTR